MNWSIHNPQSHDVGKNQYMDYEVRFQSNVPSLREYSNVVGRRRPEEFMLLKDMLFAETQIKIPLKEGTRVWQSKQGTTEEEFNETQRYDLQVFLNEVIGDDRACDQILLNFSSITMAIQTNASCVTMKNVHLVFAHITTEFTLR